MSSDGLTISTDGSAGDTTTATDIALAAAESEGLLGVEGGGVAVTNNGTVNLPYSISN